MLISGKLYAVCCRAVRKTKEHSTFESIRQNESDAGGADHSGPEALRHGE
jgi:hypothetical protein